MKKLFLAILAFISLQIPAGAQLNYVYNQRLNEVFDSVCNKLNLKGATAAIMVPGEGLWERSYGISHAGVSIDNNMYMGIGSNTKTYFATLMLKLQEQGKLSLDDTIGKWIHHPNIPGVITIRQMLNHTSGLFSFTSSSKMNDFIKPDFTRIWPPDSVLNMVEPPVAPPGSPWDYCNTNYLVAGLIIRAVTGQPAHEVLRNEILKPQGLTETFFFPQETPTGTIPHAWSMVLSPGNYMDDMIADHNYSHNAMFSIAGTAGALMTTARDNAKFWDRLMSGQILNSASMAEMETLVTIDANQGYGLGIFSFNNYNGRKVVSHGGTNFGFINDNIHDKSNGVSITVLTNQDSVSNNDLLNKLIKALHKVTIQYTSVYTINNTEHEISIYPNPASNEININIEHEAQLTIYSITGKTVAQSNMLKGKNTINTNSLTAGTYYLDIKKEGNPIHRQTIQIIH